MEIRKPYRQSFLEQGSHCDPEQTAAGGAVKRNSLRQPLGFSEIRRPRVPHDEKRFLPTALSTGLFTQDHNANPVPGMIIDKVCGSSFKTLEARIKIFFREHGGGRWSAVKTGSLRLLPICQCLYRGGSRAPLDGASSCRGPILMVGLPRFMWGSRTSLRGLILMACPSPTDHACSPHGLHISQSPPVQARSLSPAQPPPAQPPLALRKLGMYVGTWYTVR